MIKDSLNGLNGRIEYKVYDKNGYLREQGETKNAIVDGLKTMFIDWLNASGASPSTVSLTAMAIGTGTGQTAISTALAAKVSYDSDSGGSNFVDSQPSANAMRIVCTFGCSAVGGWAIKEAGLFNVATCASGMYAYNDSLNNTLALGDSIQLTWTLTYS
jgi:hypothetical protein